MSWITITADQVAGRMTAAEYNAFANMYLAPGKTSPLPEIISSVTARVRGYVAGNSSNTLQAGNTIPPELLDAALAIAVYRLVTRCPLKKEFTETRKDANDEAIAELVRVSQGKFHVASAALGQEAADQPQGSIEDFLGQGHNPSVAEMDGLI